MVTESPFATDVTTDFDPTLIFNDIALTQLAAPATPGGAASGVTVTLVNQASLSAYGDLTLQQTSYLTDPAVVTDQANWIANQYGQPGTRISQLTLDPAANPALWPVVLGMETGQVAQCNLRLAGTRLEVNGQFQIMTVAPSMSPGSWRTAVTLVPYLGNVLTADDTTRGVLGAGNPLGW